MKGEVNLDAANELLLNGLDDSVTTITIESNEVLVGSDLIVRWNTMTSGTIVIPDGVSQSLVTNIKSCNHKWTLAGHTKYVLCEEELWAFAALLLNDVYSVANMYLGFL